MPAKPVSAKGGSASGGKKIKKAPAKEAKKPAKPAAKKAPSAAKAVKKIKVTDLAKVLKLEPKKLMGILNDLGVAVKTTASSIDEEQAKLVRDLVLEEKTEKPKQEAKPEEKVIAEIISAPGGKEPEKEPDIELLKAEPKEEIPPAVPEKILDLPTSQINTRDLAARLGVRPADMIKELMMRNILVTINQNLDISIADSAAKIFGYTLQVKTKDEEKAKPIIRKEGVKLALRPPIVTVMGHVDHGKTKLLDAIRNTNVVATESGGITQHIGAYQVDVHGRKVTFLDTPGHEAFTALRARGAKATDIAVLVVAADDGVKPQTLEAIDHARAAEVPIIVAINKIDKPEANVDRVKQQLSEIGLIPEDWGGKTVMVPISARNNIGIPDILEMILLVADMEELKADPNQQPATGVVIESQLDKKQGVLATVLVQEGTLRVGDSFVVGNTWGKVRALITDTGRRVDQALPATPIEVLGFSGLPNPGDKLQTAADDKEARVLASQHQALQTMVFKGRLQSLEDFSRLVKEGEEVKNLNIIVKADVQGSLEALVGALSNLSTASIRINIVHSGAGEISESDVMLAAASGSIVIGFRVDFGPGVEDIARGEGVDVRRYDIIYKATEDVQLAIEGMFEPEYEEVIVGQATVRNLFHFSKVGTIAGSFVTEGKLTRNAGVKVFREGNEVHVGKLDTLKRFKDDVREVESNFECGLTVKNFDFKEGDQVQAFEMRPKKRSLS